MENKIKHESTFEIYTRLHGKTQHSNNKKKIRRQVSFIWDETIFREQMIFILLTPSLQGCQPLIFKSEFELRDNSFQNF